MLTFFTKNNNYSKSISNGAATNAFCIGDPVSKLQP